jgi:ribosomal protein S18 acetylase RimI-like enzyme
MSDSSIRRATEGDIAVLVELTLREAAEAERLTLSVEDATRGVRAAFAAPPLSTYWVAVDRNGAVVASTSIVKEWSNFHGADYWWIQSLYVLPAHRGTGLADRLLEHLARTSRQAGALELRLYVHGSNRRAIRAYRRCGFTAAPYAIMSLRSASGRSDETDEVSP